MTCTHRATRRAVRAAACVLTLALGPASCATSGLEPEVDLLVELLALEPGDVVADVGAGDGDHALALARRVGPEGTVHATEIETDKREALAAAAREAGLPQVRVAEARPDATGLPTACCDAAFLRDVYHHVTEPEALMTDLFRTIRPGGRLVLIDFPPTFWLAPWTPDGVPESRGGHGIARELLVAEAEAAGFVALRTVDPWPSSNFVTRTYGVSFERP